MNFDSNYNKIFIWWRGRLRLIYNTETSFSQNANIHEIKNVLNKDDFDWVAIEKFGKPEVSKISTRRWFNKKVWKNKEV